MSDYRAVNKAQWDERAPAHAASVGYSVDRFQADPAFLSDVVRFDRPRLGDIVGLRGLHLQCHIGTDTVSLARLGARMTGLDFSSVSLTQARALALAAGADIDFVESDVYDAPAALAGRTYDLVYTGVGALCWLPRIGEWAETVSSLLAPGGRLFIREGHPVLWSIDERRTDGVLALEYPYFEHAEPLEFVDASTYVETDVEFTQNRSLTWNRGLGEVIAALIDAGLVITGVAEHDTVPWEALPGFMHLVGNGEWQLVDRPERLPMTYTLQARKPG
ncbi:MAG: methyltransferase family protein [Pseudonocardiales bacterium]|nr:methyltransferase family protein [Pseudonocardiales bacterium]